MNLTPSRLRYKQLVFSFYVWGLKRSIENTCHQQVDVQKIEKGSTKIIREMSGKKEDIKSECSRQESCLT